MAKRKSLNRRSGRFSRAGGDSRYLDPDTKLLGEEESYWWRNLEDNTVTARRSRSLNIANETTRHLDPTFRLDSSKAKNEWWKLLDASDAARSEKTVQHKEPAAASDAEEGNNDNVSGDSESGEEQLQKKKRLFRAWSRKSVKGNAFLSALNTSEESTASMPLPKTSKHDFNNPMTSGNADQGPLTRSKKSPSDSTVNRSQSLELVVKQKPKLIRRRKMSKSRNMFDEVLEDTVPDTPRTASLRRSIASGIQEGDGDDQSIVVAQPRASTLGASFDNNDSESSNALIPKAQSTMLECTVQLNLSDSVLSEKNAQKLKPKASKLTTKSGQSNQLQNTLTNEDSPKGTEENIEKNDLIKEKSQRKESSRNITATLIRNSSAVSNKILSTSIQKRQKKSSFIAENDASQIDVDESDSSLSGFKVIPPYKPKSKFLGAWNKSNQQKHTSKSHTELGEELQDVGQSNTRAKNTDDESGTEVYDAALRMSPDLNDEESANPEEHRESRDDSLSNETGNKSTKAAASHLENSATFNRLNVLSAKSKTSLTNSRQSMVRTKQRSSRVLDDKLTESIDDQPANPEIARTSTKDVLQDKTHRSRDAHDKESSNDDEANANDNDKMKESLRRSPRSKSSSHRVSRTTSKTAIVIEEDTRREDDQIVGRTMRSNTQSMKLTTSQNSLIRDKTDNEDGQTIEQSLPKRAHKRSSHNISSNPVPKGSKTVTMTVAEDDADEDDNQIISRSTRGSTSNKWSSRRISDSPPSKVAKPANTVLPASDTEDEVDDNKRRSPPTSIRKRSSRSVQKTVTPKASRTRISTVADDDASDEDEQVITRSTRASARNKSSSRRISDSPKAAKATNTHLPQSDTDEKINENKRRSSRSNTHERSSRLISESITTRTPRNKISTIAEDDAQEEDDQIIERSTRRSTYNKSLSRRIPDSPSSKTAETANSLLPASDSDDEVDENTLRSSRYNMREKSSRRISESITTRGSRSKVSTIAEDDEQVIKRNTRRSTRSKASATIDQEVSVSIEELSPGNRSSSKSSKRESMISVDDKENSTHELRSPAKITTKEKLNVLDDGENDEDVDVDADVDVDVDEDDTETFQLITTRNGRSSTTSEGIGRNLSSSIFRGRKAKVVSHKEDGDLGAEADVEDTGRLKPTSSRKPSSRISRTSEVKQNTLTNDRVSGINESTSEKMRLSTRLKAVSEENRSDPVSSVSKAKTAKESVANVQKDDDPSAHVPRPLTSSKTFSTSMRILETSSDSESSDFDIMSKGRRTGSPMESIVHKRRSDDSSTSDEDEAGKENDIHHSETIGRKSVNNSPRSKSVNPPPAQKSATNLKDAHLTEDNASAEEDQDTAKTGATGVSSLGKGHKVRDMSSINISSISGRSPILSSTRRSMFPTVSIKRVSKLPSQRSSKVPPVDQPMDDDFVVQEDERLEPDNRKSRKRMSRVSGSDQNKLSEGSRKSANTAQALASPSPATDGENDGRRTGHRFRRVNNTIPEETSPNHKEPAENRTLKEPSAQNQQSIANKSKRANVDVEKGMTLDKSPEDSQMIPQGNSTVLSIFGKKKTIANESRSKGKPGTKERNLGKVFSQAESATQRSMLDFLKGGTQKRFNPTSISGQTDSQSQLPSASQVLSDPIKMKEFKKRMADIIKEDEAVSVQKKPNVSPPKKVKPVKKKTTLLNLNTNVKPKKPIDSAYLVNGKVYKPGPPPRPKYWITNRLYQHLEKCLLPKYGISTRVRSEKFIKHLAAVTTVVSKRKKYSNYKDDVDSLMKEMAHLGIINNRDDFYHFCYNFLPYELRVKLTPILLPGNQQTIPYNPNELYTPLL